MARLLKSREEQTDNKKSQPGALFEDTEGMTVIEEQISDTYNEGTIDQKENK
jgi:hypothetical protein